MSLKNTIQNLKARHSEHLEINSFLVSVLPDLAGVLTSIGIKANVNQKSLDKFVKTEGICGKPSDLLAIEFNDKQVYLDSSTIISLMYDDGVMRSFIRAYDKIQSLATVIENNFAGETTGYGNVKYAGELFYSDLFRETKAEFPSTISFGLIYKVINTYLREKNYIIHSG